MSNLRKYLPVVLGSSLLVAQPLAANAQTSTQDLLNQVQDYSSQGIQSLNQGVGAAQFSDVSPSDWAYQALDDLVRRYDCLKGYPNGTFRGNRALSRYEFAAGLNACMQQIERLIAETTADFVTREDLEALQRLMEEFEAELAALGARVDALESRVSFLEDNSFSTTTKLAGEVLVNLQQAFYDGAEDFDDGNDGDFLIDDSGRVEDEITFTGRVRLNLNTSFTGRDRLRTRLQWRNFDDFNIANVLPANDARLAYRGDTGGNVEIAQLYYRTPVLNDKGLAQVWASGGGIDDIITPLTPFNSSGGGALSRFGQRNPLIYRGNEDAAVGLRYALSDALQLEFGYLAGEANDPTKGIFSGSYAIPVQLTFEAGKFSVGAAYVHGHSGSDGLNHDTGSQGANVAARDANNSVIPTSYNAYGLEAMYDVSDSFFIGAWAGFSDAVVEGTGTAEVWNYATYLGFPDLGGDGNLLGLVLGVQPYLGGAEGQLATNNALDLGSGGVGDPDNGFHLEAFYKIKLTNSIEITPGFIWLTAPNHNENNSDILMGAIRTRFRF